MTAPQDDLEPVTAPETIVRHLKYAQDFHEKVSLLIEPEQLRLDALGVSAVHDDLRIVLEVPTAAALIPQDIKILESKESRLSFAVNDILFFAQAEPIALRGQALELRIINPIYKLQRRNAVRIKVLASHQATVEIAGKIYQLHDLSASGLSFTTTDGHEGEFIPRTMLQSCVLRFAKLEAKVNLEVMSVSRMKNENLFKVGFRFMGLAPALEQRIAREAYLHTHKIWNRRI